MNEQLIVAALTPVLVALVRKGAQWLEQELPPVLLPVIAPAVSVAANFLLGLVGITSGGLAIEAAAAAGLMGVGLREVADQGVKALKK